MTTPELRYDGDRMISAPSFALAGIRRLLRSGKAAAVCALVVIAVSAPLYLLGYHEGAWRLFGIALCGAVLGPLAFVLGSAFMNESGVRVTVRLLRGLWVRQPMLMGLSSGLLLIGLTINELFYYWAMDDYVREVLGQYATNRYSSWFKPLAHVGAGAALFGAVCPSVLIGVPIAAKVGCDVETATDSAREVAQNRMYSFSGAFFLMVCLAVFAMVPFMGILAVPLMCAIGIEMYWRLYNPGPRWA